MADQDTTSPITRLVPGLTIIALLIIIAAAIFRVMTLEESQAPAFSRENAPATPDYTGTEGWYLKPAAELPGGWERPWGVDLFWFADRVDTYAAGWNAPLDWVGADTALTDMTDTADQIAARFGIYAPRRRFASDRNGAASDVNAALALETEDVMASFDYYADDRHKLRGIFLGGTDEGLIAAETIWANRINDTRPFDSLFGGVIYRGDLPENSAFSKLPDCDGKTFPCKQQLAFLSGESDAEAISNTLNGFSDWLEENEPKPAAPLPPIETIEIAPINKPDGQ